MTRGELLFEGHSLLKVRAHQRPGLGIALVPAGRELWPQLTVRENLELGAFSQAARASRAETLDWVFGLFPVLRERARQLGGSMSGGEQQMVAIARALMSRPRLLMMDEPSLGLAPVVVSHMFATIRRLHLTLRQQRGAAGQLRGTSGVPGDLSPYDTETGTGLCDVSYPVAEVK